MTAVWQTIGVIVGLIIFANVIVGGALLLRVWLEDRAKAAVAKLKADAAGVIDAARTEQREFDRHWEQAVRVVQEPPR